MAGARLEQAVGEATGRGADVEGAPAIDRDAARRERFELDAPRETKRGAGATVTSTSLATSWPGFWARAALTVTSPASTAAAARERDSNRPRSASSASSLSFAATAEPARG